MITLRPLRCLALALAVSTAWVNVAHADGVDPGKATPVQREQAQSRFLKGRELYGQAQYEAALAEFSASHEIVASPNARLYMARCSRELGRLVAAYSELGRTAVEAREQSRDDPRYVRTGETADEERRAIAPKLGFVTLTIANAKDTTVLKVGGEEIRRSGWTEAIPVSPGASEVVVTTPSREPLAQTVNVAAGETKAMSFDAATAREAIPPAQPPAVMPAPPPETDTREASRVRMRTMSYVAGGVGVAGLATFAIFGALSNAKFDDLQTACHGPCPASRQDDVDAGKRDQTIANVALVVGLIGVAAGVTLFVISTPKKQAPPSSGFAIAPVGSGVGGVF